MKFFRIMPLLLLTIIALHVNAQRGGLKLNINYNYGLPTADFKTQVVSDASPRGVMGDLLYTINDHFAVGLGVGYQDFYQKYPRSLYNTGDHEVTSAVLSNSVQIMPVLAKAEVYPMGGKKFPVQPYISLGAGLGLTSFTQYLGEFGGTNNSSKLMLQGGAGFAVPFSNTGRTGFRFGANYNMITYKQDGFGNFNNLSLQAGFYLPLK